jgi:pyruvate-formate lyase-activating enzyme
VTPQPPATGYFTTKEKLLTRRGVLWLGQTCNLRCHFCYFLDRIEDHSHPEHAFMELEKAKHICHELRYRYGNTAIDIQGGEPTIYPRINDLVRYCRDIGLYPSLITNAIILSRRERCEQLQAAGLRDLKISVQGLGSVFDETVGRPGSSQKQAQAIQHCIDLGIPFRFNCVLTINVLPQLVELANLAIDAGALAVNFLGLNPFQDQATGKRTAYNVPRYSEVGEALDDALDVLAAAGVEANVRYLPICTVSERHRASVYDYQQLSYDGQEWDFDSWAWSGQLPQQMKEGDTSSHHTSLAALTYSSSVFADPPGLARRVARALRVGARRALGPFPRAHSAARAVYSLVKRAARTKTAVPPRRDGTDQSASEIDELGRDPQVYRDTGIIRAQDRGSDQTTYEHPPQCMECDAMAICDGFHFDYVGMFGASEATPIQVGQRVTDPLHFIREQTKVYEREEAARPFRHAAPYTRRQGSTNIASFWEPSTAEPDAPAGTVQLLPPRRRPPSS